MHTVKYSSRRALIDHAFNMDETEINDLFEVMAEGPFAEIKGDNLELTPREEGLEFILHNWFQFPKEFRDEIIFIIWRWRVHQRPKCYHVRYSNN